MPLSSNRPRFASPALAALPSDDRWAVGPATQSQAIAGLPSHERDALHLVEIRGSSYATAALLLGVTRDEIKRLVFAGRRRLLSIDN
ncbi:MAG: sigma factor-like helix-turn-helix DNA-binding protein [Planctomycetota bacterium]